MANAVKNSRRRSALLRRSILKQAFAGKLVLQEPTDEPASVLLERIAAARATEPKVSRGSRKVPA
jgi:type I restriction enzyme, S subunit